MKSRLKKLLAAVLIVCMVCSLMPISAFAATGISNAIEKGSRIDGTDYKVTSVKNYSIAPDITEKVIITNNDAGNSQTVANVMEVDTSNGNAKIVTGYGNRNPSELGWTMMTTTNQAHVYEKETGENVVGGINASWFNIDTGEPSGYLVMNGVVHHNNSKRAYVAAFSDGSVNVFKEGTLLSNAEATQSEKRGHPVTVVEAVDALVALVWDGQVANAASGNDGCYPRSCIGVKADGSVVILQADGTMAPRSVGYTALEEANMMLALGCVAAIQLDEGGSSTYISQREGEKDLSMRNTPAGGSERVISGSILIVSTVKASGEFHHANITPNEEYFTPNSTVALTAEALDYSGASVSAMPEDARFVLADPAMGEMSETTVSGKYATATFTANDIVGSAVVNIVSGDKVVGKANINIQNPDEIAFTSKEVNLVYGEVSTLGLNAKYLGEPVNLKAGDIAWSISDETAGTFDGLRFTATSDKKFSGSPTITASFGELNASVSVNIGKQPAMIMDGGDEDIWDYSTIGNTVESFDGMAADAVATYKYAGRGGLVKGSVVSDTDAEYADVVRFGHNAIKLEFDWRNLGGTDGACLGLGQPLDIDGTPTAIGVWVYIPDDTTPVPWLRAQVATSTNGGQSWTPAFVNFSAGSTVTGEGLKVGWQYLEADLTQYAGSMIRINSGMLFRAMVTMAGIGWYNADGEKLSKDQLTGYIIIDNISIVYGANNQDVTPPTVNSISIVNADGTKTELEDGAVLGTDNRFFVSYNDNEETDENATGVESAYFYFDGIYRGEFDRDNLGSTSPVMKFGEGQHSITFYLKDGYGNVTRETRYFAVESDAAELPGVEFVTDGSPVVNRAWHHYLCSDRPEDLEQISATITVTRTYPVSDVVFPAGVTGTWNYNETKGILDINITSVDKEVFDADYLADVVVNIPKTIYEGSTISVQVTKATYSCAQSEAENIEAVCSFSTPLAKYDIESPYSIKADTAVKGSRSSITVTVIKDNVPAVGLKVYANNKLVGLTNDNGQVEISGLITELGSFEFYAVDNKGYVSYSTTVFCYDAVGPENGTPYYIHFNNPNSASSEKSISWMCNPSSTYANALMLISTNEDMSNAWDIAGYSRLIPYSSSNMINRVNTVNVTGLNEGTTYYYQVGDGYIWSEVKSFTTATEDGKTNFFVLADIQEDDAITGMQRIGNCVSGKPYDFGAQLGDAIDNVRVYEQWDAAMSLFTMDCIKDIDMVHVIGNHEADDSGKNAIAAKTAFDCNAPWYSFERGEVYVAVLNYTLQEDDLQAFAKWLADDAAASDCTWKVVMTHVPAYYTNPTGGGDIVNAYLPAACDAAGIDFFFAGNDHSYARTAPMVDGEKNDDGTVYYICGSTGGKSYAAVDNPEFNFEVATLDFNSIYVDVSADQYQITVTAYDVDSNGNASVLDQYVKRSVPVCVGEHEYVYDSNTDELCCAACGESITARDEFYNGWATDSATGKKMYFEVGEKVVGSAKIGTVPVYFDENGLGLDGYYAICGENCIFKDGYYVSSENANVKVAGISGVGVQWIITNDGVMTIDGAGEVQKYAREGNAPWSDYKADLKKIVVGENISAIGYLSKCFYVTEVVFEGNSQLTTLYDACFSYLSSLKSLVLPESVKSIGYFSFSECKNLTSLYIPQHITNINPKAFSQTDKVVLNVVENTYAHDFALKYNVKFELREGEVTEVSKGTCGDNASWILYSNGKLVICGEGAISNYANGNQPWYSYMSDIRSIDISAGITKIGAYAFYQAAKLTSVSFEEGSQLKSIDRLAFCLDVSLNEIVLPDSVTTIGDRAFAYCSALSEMYLPDQISDINSIAFKGNTNVVLNVAAGSYANKYAENAGIKFETREPETDVIAEGTCGNNAVWVLHVDGTMVIEGNGDMSNYKTYTEQPWYANIKSIRAVVVCKDITSIGAYAFYNASNLEKVSFEEGSKLTDVARLSFCLDTSLKEVVLPDGVTTIGDRAFAYCNSLTNVYMPNKINSIDAIAFKGTNNVILDVAEDSYAYDYSNAKGIKYTARMQDDSVVASGACGDEITWTLFDSGKMLLEGKGDMYDYKTYTAVPWYEHIKSIRTLEVSPDITSIGAYAFYNASNLKEVKFLPDDENTNTSADEETKVVSKLGKIGRLAFCLNTSLEKIDIPENVKSIGDRTFGYCSKLGEVVIPASVINIDNIAFKGSTQINLVVEADSYANQYALDCGIGYSIK